LNIYAFSGLGADKRVFEHLQLNHKLVCIDWIKPKKNGSLETYTTRLVMNINSNEPFVLLGVSFGGLVAVEASKMLNPRATILVSSAATKYELSWFQRLIGKTGLLKILPSFVFRPPNFVANIMFGAKNKSLLHKILRDTDLAFAKWASQQLATWNNEIEPSNLYKISGSADKLIPPSKTENTILVKDGGHFMIVDKADEVSELINGIIKNLV